MLLKVFMEIVKIFSEVDTEEMLFSVLLDEDEALLFSEFQKEFARRDYEGLDKFQKRSLKKARSEYAKELLDEHRSVQDFLEKDKDGSYVELKTRSQINGGGVTSNHEITTRRDKIGGEKIGEFKKRHLDHTTDRFLGESKKAKEIMRNNALKENHVEEFLDEKIRELNSATKKSKRDMALKNRDKELRKDFEGRVKKYKDRKASSQASIAKHQEVANKLRAKKELAKKIKVGSGIAAGTLAAAGTAYGVKKYMDSRKKKNKD